MRLRLLSRSSDLAVLQANVVADALARRWPDLAITHLTRTSQGDRDRRVDLWQAADKGLFTTDLSEALVAHEADAVVHSWKDLPVNGVTGTTVAGTLERADPRDVLLVRRAALETRPSTLTVLTSSPRRAWQLQESIAPLLPWPVDRIEPKPVRGNIPTRLARLSAGDGDALVVAKAALDRLLSSHATAEIRAAVRAALDSHRWMVLPIREFPTAPAQGALAIEIAADRPDIRDLIEGVTHADTRRAVDVERSLLSSHGGGCHEAIGATVLIRDYGVITSARGRLPSGETFAQWSLDATSTAPPSSTLAAIWPRPDERDNSTRVALDVVMPADAQGWWVARADAWPADSMPADHQIVWTAGTRTWRKLAARGIWVHGCADGLGDAEPPGVDALAGRSIAWRRVTHAASGDTSAIATYTVETALPSDLGSRTHFFWTSGSAFADAIRRYPQIRAAWHGCGPGRTSRIVLDEIGDATRVSIWLDYEQWLRHVIP